MLLGPACLDLSIIIRPSVGFLEKLLSWVWRCVCLGLRVKFRDEEFWTCAESSGRRQAGSHHLTECDDCDDHTSDDCAGLPCDVMCGKTFFYILSDIPITANNADQ